MRKISRAVLVAAALTFAGGFAVAQDDPHQSAQNSDTSLPNSPWKARGIPDSGEFNPTGPRYETPRPPPPPPPPVAPPPPPPPPAVAPPRRRRLLRRLPHLRRPRGPTGVKHHQGDRLSTVALPKASPEAFFLRLRVGLPRTPACRAGISTGDVLHPA